MNMDARMTRRCATVAVAALMLTGCGTARPADPVDAGSNAGSAPAAPASEPADAGAWSAKLDPDAPFLNIAGEQGAAMPGACWMRREDGAIQVQVPSSSIPEPKVERVALADGMLTVTMVVPDEDTPATMDYVLHQVIVTGEDAPEVTGVVLVRGEETHELPAGEMAVPEDVE